MDFDPERYTPISNLVLVRRLKGEDQVGSIVLPEEAKEPSEVAEVLKVGPGYLNDAGHFVEMTVKPGDRVVVQRHGGHIFDVDGVEYVVINEVYILAVVEDAAEAA